MKEPSLLCYLGCNTVQKMYVDKIPNEPESISASEIATYNCPKCGMSYDKAFIDDYITKNPDDFMLYYLGKQVARIHARIDFEKSKARERAAQSMEQKILSASLTPLTDAQCWPADWLAARDFANGIELRMHKAEDALEEIGKFVAFFNAAFAPMTVQQEEIMNEFLRIKDLFDRFGNFK